MVFGAHAGPLMRNRARLDVRTQSAFSQSVTPHGRDGRSRPPKRNRRSRSLRLRTRDRNPGGGGVWIELANTPHVLVFTPVVERLRREDGTRWVSR